MTIKKAVFNFLDALEDCRLSGWRLFDAIELSTGRHPYPTTLLNYAREYADITGGQFICIDIQRSIYEFKKGIVLGNASLGGKE